MSWPDKKHSKHLGWYHQQLLLITPSSVLIKKNTDMQQKKPQYTG